MTPQYNYWFKLLLDWQALIAGLLALGAGILAYKAAIKQAKETEKQTAYLQTENRRQLARNSLSANRLIRGVLDQLKTDTGRLIKLWNPVFLSSNLTGIPNSQRLIVFMPPLSTVWNSLSLLAPNSVPTYMQIDLAVERFRTSDIAGVAHCIEEVTRIHRQVSHLLTEIDGEAQACLQILADSETATAPKGNSQAA